MVLSVISQEIRTGLLDSGRRGFSWKAKAQVRQSREFVQQRSSRKCGYLGGASAGSKAFPVEVLAAIFAVAGGHVGVHRAFQVVAPHLRLPLRFSLGVRHASQHVFNGPFTPVLWSRRNRLRRVLDRLGSKV